MHSSKAWIFRLLALSFSTVISLLLAGVILDHNHQAPTVELVDNTRELSELLDSHSRVGCKGTLGGSYLFDESCSYRESYPSCESFSRHDSHTSGDNYPPALIREPIDRATADRLFCVVRKRLMEYDPVQYFKPRPHFKYWARFAEHPDKGWWTHTNSLGLRGEAEVSAVIPDLRILVTGDSHTAGFCIEKNTYSCVLQSYLKEAHQNQSVEVLNAGVPSYATYNYLSVLEAYKDLCPHLFVVAVYGGNDFSGMMSLQRFFHQRPCPELRSYTPESLTSLHDNTNGFLTQEICQVIYFESNPEDIRIAIDTTCSISNEIVRQARQADIDVVFVYLPPPFRGQPHLFREEVKPILKLLEIDEESMKVSDTVADKWMAFLKDRKISHLDLRPVFRKADKRFYWNTDHHLNEEGHRIVAEQLLPLITEIVEEK